jgi:hypothetical protein
MEMAKLNTLAGVLLIIVGPVLAAASFLAVGEAQSWDVADAFATDSMRPVRQIGMLLSVMGLAALVVSVPVVVAQVHGTRGFGLALGGWVGFAGGTVLFMMVLGLTAIAMPALGKLAVSDAVSPQLVTDGFVRQPAIMVAFLGGNVLFLSWVPIGIGLARSGLFPKWLGWLVASAAIIAWLGFLHVPGIEEYAGPLWPLALALIGVHLLRIRRAVS